MSTRAPSRAIDRAFFWNALCVALIVLAVVTAFIDLIPTEVSIGLCLLGVVAGLVGVPLYISQVIADWRSSRPSPHPLGDRREESGESEVEPAAVAPVVESDREPVETASEPAERRCSCHGLPMHD